MSLTQLTANHFRNFQSLSLTPSSGLTVLAGDNGSGKTSILEALYYLSRARSFRTNHLKNLINFDNDSFTLFCKTLQQDSTVSIGIQRESDNKTLIRINGVNVHSTSALSEYLACHLLTPESYLLIDEGPSLRRQFLDWGVFHVKHDLLPYWKRYRKALLNRNNALKMQAARSIVQAFDPELINCNQMITQAREDYLSEFNKTLERYTQLFFPGSTLKCQFYSGYPKDSDIAELLKDRLEDDLRRGFTQYGLHRADLKFTLDGKSAKEFLSRGQKKLLIYALVLTQVEIHQRYAPIPCFILLDDLPSELDEEHRRLVLDTLSELTVQTFITTTDLELVDHTAWKGDVKMFHVEHGQIKSQIKLDD